MSIFDELESLYSDIDNRYAAEQFAALSAGDKQREAEAWYNRQLNDQAYFLFMFTRLEDRIRALSKSVILKNQQSLPDWKSKSAWDVLMSQKKYLTLLDTVSLLTPKGHADYRLIQEYKLLRDKIAHGDMPPLPAIVPTVVNDMKRLHHVLSL